MATRLQVTLPAVIGTVSLPLAIWDIHNERVIASMGMAWDTGAPIWPYQTADILLRLLNDPAYFVAVPIANTLGLVSPSLYLLIFPAILLWWWFLGLQLDRRLMLSESQSRWPMFSFLVVFALLLLWGAEHISAESLRWWFRYVETPGVNTLLEMTRFLTPAAWCVFLALLAVIAAKRVAARQLA